MKHILTWEKFLDSFVLPRIAIFLEGPGLVILASLMLRILRRVFNYTKWWSHLSSALLGILILWTFFQNLAFLQIGLTAISWTFLRFSGNYRNFATVAIVFLYNFTSQAVFETEDWHRIMGVNLILSMKIVSLAFDVNEEDNHVGKKVFKLPNLLEFLGYAFNPGSTLLGPWISYETYEKSTSTSSKGLTWTWKLLKCVSLSFTFFMWSDLMLAWFFPRNGKKWTAALQHATEFRFSHYYFSYAAEGAAIAARLSEDEVARFLHVEIPTSLQAVAMNWNKPMHAWFKKYCYGKLIKYGRKSAVAMTYMTSALLHGFNFQLSAILLTLGCLQEVERLLRKNIAGHFDTKIRSQWLKMGLVKMTDFVFTLVNCLHLIYLGSPFDHSNQGGYNWRHTISIWSNLGFFSHIYLVFSFILCDIILFPKSNQKSK